MLKKVKVITTIALCSYGLVIFVSCLFAQTVAKFEKDLIEEIKRRNVEYNSEDLRDPFQTWMEEKPKIVLDNETKPQVNQAEPAKKTVTPPSLSVQGIVWGGVLPQAIVNEQIVKLGDVLGDGITISGINQEGITVTYQGLTFKFSAPAISSAINDNPDTKRRN